MGFHQEGLATVWTVEKKSDTMTSVRVSTSRKNTKTNQYEQDFSGYVAFVGKENAANALRLHEKDRIKLGKVDVSTKYDKEKKKEFINYVCFGFELVSNPHADASYEVDNGEVISDGDTPF